jgi:hypothetical protein
MQWDAASLERSENACVCNAAREPPAQGQSGCGRPPQPRQTMDRRMRRMWSSHNFTPSKGRLDVNAGGC